jgi:hypothetical protein
VWVHYDATKIGRGELFECLDLRAILRSAALAPLIPGGATRRRFATRAGASRRLRDRARRVLRPSGLLRVHQDNVVDLDRAAVVGVGHPHLQLVAGRL